MATAKQMIPDIPRMAWSVDEAADQLGVCRNFLLSQIKKGTIRAKRLGDGRGRIVILDEDLKACLENAETV